MGYISFSIEATLIQQIDADCRVSRSTFWECKPCQDTAALIIQAGKAQPKRHQLGQTQDGRFNLWRMMLPLRGLYFFIVTFIFCSFLVSLRLLFRFVRYKRIKPMCLFLRGYTTPPWMVVKLPACTTKTLVFSGYNLLFDSPIFSFGG